MDISDSLAKLNEIQKKVYEVGLTKDMKDEWNLVMTSLRLNGISVGKKRDRFTRRVVWVAKGERNRNFYCEWVSKDLSPNHKHLKGNCTTRALAYIITDKTYDEIEREQYRLAEEHNKCYWNRVRRNTQGIWDKLIIDRGYVKVSIGRTIRRDKVANILKDIENPMISRSRSHVCIIHNGKVIDNWDSRCGRVYEIFVKKSDEESVKRRLGIV